MLQLNLHPSRYFLMLILLIHISAVLVILALSLKWWAVILIEALILASFVHAVQKYILRKSNETIVVIEINEQLVTLISRAGEKIPAVLMRESSSNAFLVTLNFKLLNRTKAKKITVFIFSDSVVKSDFRRLRARLKTWKFK